jgi:hypothetical protein
MLVEGAKSRRWGQESGSSFETVKVEPRKIAREENASGPHPLKALHLQALRVLRIVFRTLVAACLDEDSNMVLASVTLFRDKKETYCHYHYFKKICKVIVIKLNVLSSHRALKLRYVNFTLPLRLT